MQSQDANTAYTYVMNSHPRGSSVREPIVNSCNLPWRTVNIDAFTNCMLCRCDGWLPKPVGKITDFDSLEQIWSNPQAKIIQADVESKKYTWCAVQHCGVMQEDIFQPHYELIFGIDNSCNLACPSCRREKIMHTQGDLFEQKLQAVEHTVKLLNKFEHRIHVTLASTGDPLASHIYRPLLHSYQGQDSQTFTLFTNGLLIKKQLDKTALLDRITEFRISVDAGSASTYEQVRLGGDWNVLMQNFDYLHEQGRASQVRLMYVVQQQNFRDIPKFVQLLEHYGFSGTLMQLDDWGTWNHDVVALPDTWTQKHGTFRQHNVLDSRHGSHAECRSVVESVLDHPRLWLTPRLLQQLNLTRDDA